MGYLVTSTTHSATHTDYMRIVRALYWIDIGHWCFVYAKNYTGIWIFLIFSLSQHSEDNHEYGCGFYVKVGKSQLIITRKKLNLYVLKEEFKDVVKPQQT